MTSKVLFVSVSLGLSLLTNSVINSIITDVTVASFSRANFFRDVCKPLGMRSDSFLESPVDCTDNTMSFYFIH